MPQLPELEKHPEMQDEVLDYVTKTGHLQDVSKVLSFKLTDKSVENYIKKHPAFKAKYYEARRKHKKLYAAKHPHADNDLVLTAHDRYAHLVTHGWERIVDYEYHEDGLLKGKLKRTRIHSPNINKWVWDGLHPQELASEQAIRFIVASEYQHLVDVLASGKLPKEAESWIQLFLKSFQEAAYNELEARGIEIKYRVSQELEITEKKETK